MSQAQDMHREAMQIASLGDRLKDQGDLQGSREAYSRAFVLEREAAILVWGSSSNALTKGVLVRSAATLGFLAGEIRDAEKLVGLGLSGDIPAVIADELRDLYENLTFGRHLDLRGKSLSNVEFRLTVHGNLVGHGIAPTSEINSRQEFAEKLIYRTAERLSNKEYREKGTIDADLRSQVEPFQQVPEAASYALVFRLGSQNPQLDMFDRPLAERTIQAIFDGIGAISDNDGERLQALIPDHKYRTNFTQLVHGLAPDGDRISLVGFTSSINGQSNPLALRRTREDILNSFPNTKSSMSLDSGDPVSLTMIGELRMADESGKKPKIKIIPEKGKPITIEVPDGLGDIVVAYWGQLVSASYLQKGNSKELLSMVPVVQP